MIGMPRIAYAATVVLQVVSALLIAQNVAPAEEEPALVCGSTTTVGGVNTHTHTGPELQALVPKQFTRNEVSANCCPPQPEMMTCENTHSQVVLQTAWTVTGGTNCEATFLSCHSGDCFTKFQYITRLPGSSGTENGDTWNFDNVCMWRHTQTFKYTQKTVETESFTYYGWCKAGDVMKKEWTQDCARTEVKKIENADGQTEEGCANEPACQA